MDIFDACVSDMTLLNFEYEKIDLNIFDTCISDMTLRPKGPTLAPVSNFEYEEIIIDMISIKNQYEIFKDDRLIYRYNLLIEKFISTIIRNTTNMDCIYLFE